MPQTLSMVINGVLVVMSPAAWLMLALGAGDSKGLAERGVHSLKYFTVLSNLLSCLASLAYLVWSLAVGTPAPTWLLVLKLMTAAAVMLTFLTVIVLLGPVLGWKKMYSSGNLWMHLILPLLAAVDCVLFVPVGTLPFVVTFVSAIPCALYAVWYLSMVVRHGAEKDGVVYDFYGFLRWGWSKVPLVTASMITVSWLLGLALWWGSRALGH